MERTSLGSAERAKLRKYLLGQLSQMEVEQLERLYFAQSEMADELWAVFGDLTREFMQGALSEEETQRFAARVHAAPALREMFELERGLQALAENYQRALPASTASAPFASPTARRFGWWSKPLITPLKLAGAFCTVLLLAGLAWLYWPARKNVSLMAVNKTPAPTPQPYIPPTVTPTVILREKTPRPTGPKDDVSTHELIASFYLADEGVRAAQDLPKLELPAQAMTLRLELELTGQTCSQYDAVLTTESGAQVRRWQNLARQKTQDLVLVTLQLPATAVENGDYQVTLECAAKKRKHAAPPEHHRFRIERQ